MFFCASTRRVGSTALRPKPHKPDWWYFTLPIEAGDFSVGKLFAQRGLLARQQRGARAGLSAYVILHEAVFHSQQIVLCFDHVADGDDADQFPLIHHWQVSDSLSGHQPHDLFDRVAR